MSLREDFEKWADSEGYAIGKYLDVRTHHAWVGFAAAYQIMNEKCAKVCEEQNETGAHKRCAAAIRALD